MTETMEISVHGRPLRVAPRDAREAGFWRSVANGGWETETLALLEPLVKEADLFIDIGAWIGPMTLFAASAGAKVLALEPDPVALEGLRANVALNQSEAGGIEVEIIPRAIHHRAEALSLFPGPHGHGDSMSSLVSADGARNVRRAGAGEGVPAAVEAITLEEIRARIPEGARYLVKMDIEGHEYALGPAISALMGPGALGFELSLHPRAIYNAEKAARGGLAARVAAYRQTIALVEAFAGVDVQAKGKPVSIRRLAARRILFGGAGPKNFAVFLTPRS